VQHFKTVFKIVLNASKYSIDQSKKRILQIDQSKNASKHLWQQVDRNLYIYKPIYVNIDPKVICCIR